MKKVNSYDALISATYEDILKKSELKRPSSEMILLISYLQSSVMDEQTEDLYEYLKSNYLFVVDKHRQNDNYSVKYSSGDFVG